MLTTEQKDMLQKLQSFMNWAFFAASAFLCWLWLIVGLVGTAFGNDVLSEDTGIIWAASGLCVVFLAMPASVMFGLTVFRIARWRFRWVILPVSFGPPAVLVCLLIYTVVAT